MALTSAFAAFALMIGVGALLVVRSQHKGRREDAGDDTQINMGMPFSLTQALKYGLIFMVLHVLGALTQQQFGNAGFYVVSVVGGLLSSASAVAAAAALAAQGTVAPSTAGIGAVLASFTSIAFSFSFVLRSRSRSLIRQVGVAVLAVALAGGIGLMLSHVAEPWVEALLGQLQHAVPAA